MRDLRKGSTMLLALHVLSETPMYGFELADELMARTGGVLAFAEGMLYPMLHKMEREGLLVSEWRPSADGPPRKYYAPTTEGTRELARRRADWDRFATALGSALGAPKR